MTAGKDATLSTDVTIGPDVGATIAGAVPLETTEVRSVGATSGTTGGADRVGSTIAQRGTGTTGVGSAGGTSGLDAGVTIVADSAGGMTGLDVGGTSVAVDLVETIAGSRVGAATTGVGSIGGMIGLDAGVMTVVDSIGGTRGVVGLVGRSRVRGSGPRRPAWVRQAFGLRWAPGRPGSQGPTRPATPRRRSSSPDAR
ncbi:hypothetical protein [Saccharomonospora azurea]|uniref:hypothetical protein n=1 Tax=Saccharomonospora azurea TaxID=40988 RepID=UPI00055A08A4|nr:hypothetical protein [Saccharomonospora azurea]